MLSDHQTKKSLSVSLSPAFSAAFLQGSCSPHSFKIQTDVRTVIAAGA